MGSGSFVDHASGGVAGVLASNTTNTMVKGCCGSSFLIVPPWVYLKTARNAFTKVLFECCPMLDQWDRLVIDMRADG